MSESKITALVTGASSGLGVDFCRQLAERCDVIIGVARRLEPMQALAAELEGQAEMHCIQADLTTVEGVTRALEALRQMGPVDYLVNNVGFATAGSFEEEEIESQHQMVSLHINATLDLCQAAIGFMRERGGGYIINVSSVGAFVPGRGLAVYGATKSFLNTYSQSLQSELQGSGIKVQALCPGYTRTGFHDTAALQDWDKTQVPDAMWMESAEVVRQSLEALAGEQVIVVTGDTNRDIARGALQQQLDAL